MADKKCKDKKQKEGPPKPKKFVCKKCNLTSNKENRLCKPEKSKA